MIIFLTVICLGSCLYFYWKLNNLKLNMQTLNKILYDDIKKLTFELSSDLANLHLKNYHIEVAIKEAKKEIVEMIEKERVSLEAVKATRSKDTFKSLRTALASKGNEPDED